MLVVEHDPEAIRAADYMVELGPGERREGRPARLRGPDLAHRRESAHRARISPARREIPVPVERRRLGPALDHAHRRARAQPQGRRHQDPARRRHRRDRRFRLRQEHARYTTSCSARSRRGCTASTRAKQHLGETVGAFDTITGVDAIDDVVGIDQSPIGKSPRSNPVTYVKAFDEIRRIFADAPLSRERRYTAGTFSFNVAGGRCETCEGAGYLEVEMVFMADVFVPCDDCGGKRFKPAVLDVRVNGKNIYEVLELTIDEAIRFFPREEKLGQALWQLQQVGLGYLRLGQPATTLSGGEAQRLKVARELALTNKKSGKKLYVMDEPTTGLHLDDIRKLAQRLRPARRRRTHARADRAQPRRHQARRLGDRSRARGGRPRRRGRRDRPAGGGRARRGLATPGSGCARCCPGFAEYEARRPHRSAARARGVAGGLSRWLLSGFVMPQVAALTSTTGGRYLSSDSLHLIPDSSVGRALDC